VESLFAIVEQLSGEELSDLVRNGVGWVVYETGASRIGDGKTSAEGAVVG
jgi:hypothetical protein